MSFRVGGAVGECKVVGVYRDPVVGRSPRPGRAEVITTRVVSSRETGRKKDDKEEKERPCGGTRRVHPGCVVFVG